MKRDGLIVAPLIFIALFLHFNFMSNGTLKLFPMEGTGLWGNMAEHLLQGRLDIHPLSVYGEAFFVDGGTRTYFGVMPAIPRLIGLGLRKIFDFDPMYSFTFFSVALAIIITFYCALKTYSMICKRAEEKGLLAKQGLSKFIPFLYLISSPILLLSAEPNIYNESILWGVCWAHCFIFILMKSALSSDFSKKNLALLALFAGLALHSRVTQGLALYITLFSIIIHLSLSVCRKLAPQKVKIKNIVLLVFIALFFGLAQLGINYVRWGNPLTIQDSKVHMHTSIDPGRLAAVSEYPRFSFRRLTNNFNFYFLPNKEALECFPFSKIARHDLPKDDWLTASYDYHEDSRAPLSTTIPFLLILSFLGAYVFSKNRTKLPELWLVTASITISATILLLLYLMLQFVAIRYLGDLMPYLFVLLCWIPFLPPSKSQKYKLFLHPASTAIVLILSIGTTLKNVIDDETLTRGQQYTLKTKRKLWPLWHCDNLFEDKAKMTSIEGLHSLNKGLPAGSLVYDQSLESVIKKSKNGTWTFLNGKAVEPKYVSAFSFSLKEITQLAPGLYPLVVNGVERTANYYSLLVNDNHTFQFEMKSIPGRQLRSEAFTFKGSSLTVDLGINSFSGFFSFCSKQLNSECFTNEHPLWAQRNFYYLENPFSHMYPTYQKFPSKNIASTLTKSPSNSLTRWKYSESLHWKLKLLNLPSKQWLHISESLGIDGANLYLFKTYDDLYSFRLKLPNNGGFYTWSRPMYLNEIIDISVSFNKDSHDILFCLNGRDCHHSNYPGYKDSDFTMNWNSNNVEVLQRTHFKGD